MKHYLITDDTVALLKKGRQTIMYDVNKYRVINKNIKKIMNDNCIIHGSTLDGRIVSAQKILNKKYKVPIYVDENLIFLRIGSFRSDDCLLIVANKIIDYEKTPYDLKIICVDNCVFNVNLSINSFEKMLLNYFKLNNRLNGKNL